METMTREDKDLLMKDLCARLPYGVKCYDEAQKETGIFKHFEYEGFGRIHNGRGVRFIENIKPYLFPLSSMTEKQKKEFITVAGYETRIEDCGRHQETYYYDCVGHENELYPNSDAIDWFNKNHFDYRGMIEKGLAIDATGLNIY